MMIYSPIHARSQGQYHIKVRGSVGGLLWHPSSPSSLTWATGLCTYQAANHNNSFNQHHLAEARQALKQNKAEVYHVCQLCVPH